MGEYVLNDKSTLIFSQAFEFFCLYQQMMGIRDESLKKNAWDFSST